MTKIYVKGKVSGLHYWKDAPKSLDFIKRSHRHTFDYKVITDVKHDDREIEFFQFKNSCEMFFATSYPQADGFINLKDFGSQSCEMIAQELMEYLLSIYKDRQMTVEVSEDDECGAIVCSNQN